MANGNFGGGNGTSATPYLIQDQADFFAIGNNPTAYYRLVSDITLTSNTPTISSFSGQIDGDNKSVSNFNPTGNYWILTSTNATIKNINFHDVNLTQKPGLTGLFVSAFSNSLIENVNITGTFQYTNSTGSNGSISLYVNNFSGDNPSISNCSVDSTSTITVQGSANIFGTSSNTSHSVNNCSNRLSITVTSTSASTITFSGVTAFDCINYGNFFLNNTTSNSQSIAGITNKSATRCVNRGMLSATSSNTSTRISGIAIVNAFDCANYGQLIGNYISGIAEASATRCVNYGSIRTVFLTGTTSYIIGGITSASRPNTNCFFAGSINVSHNTSNVYYGNSSDSSTANVNLKVLDTSTITVGA